MRVRDGNATPTRGDYQGASRRDRESKAHGLRGETVAAADAECLATGLDLEGGEAIAMAIYALIDPRTSKVRYVGQCARPNQRLEEHVRRPGSRKLKSWIAELNRRGVVPVMKILKRYKTEAAAIRWQRPDLNTVAGRTVPHQIREVSRVVLLVARADMELVAEAMQLDHETVMGQWFRRAGVVAAR